MHAVRGLKLRSRWRWANRFTQLLEFRSGFLCQLLAGIGGYSRTYLGVRAAQVGAVGRRSGPKMNSPATIRMSHSPPPIPNIGPTYGARGAPASSVPVCTMR